MRTLQRAIIALAVASVPATAAAQTINFDNIPPYSNTCNNVIDNVPNGYGGFQWNNILFGNSCSPGLQGTGLQYGATSKYYSAANYFSNGSFYVNSGTFSLGTIQMTAAFNNGQVGFVRGYNGSNLLFQQMVTLNLQTPTLVSFNWNGIDRVEFDGAGMPMVMDDINLNATPEPATMLLLGSGLTGMGGMIRLRRRKK